MYWPDKQLLWNAHAQHCCLHMDVAKRVATCKNYRCPQHIGQCKNFNFRSPDRWWYHYDPVEGLSIVVYLHWCTCTLYGGVLALSIVVYLHSLWWCTCTLYCGVLALYGGVLVLSMVVYLHSMVVYLHSMVVYLHSLWGVLVFSIVVHLYSTVCSIG